MKPSLFLIISSCPKAVSHIFLQAPFYICALTIQHLYYICWLWTMHKRNYGEMELVWPNVPLTFSKALKEAWPCLKCAEDKLDFHLMLHGALLHILVSLCTMHWIMVLRTKTKGTNLSVLFNWVQCKGDIVRKISRSCCVCLLFPLSFLQYDFVQICMSKVLDVEIMFFQSGYRVYSLCFSLLKSFFAFFLPEISGPSYHCLHINPFKV